jgi:hypothetical protein
MNEAPMKFLVKPGLVIDFNQKIQKNKIGMGARFWWCSVVLLLIFHSSGCNRVQEHEQASTCEAGVGSAVCSDTRTESKKIRVAFVTHGMGVGGVERQIILTASSVDRSKIHMEVVLFQERGVWAHHLEDMGIRVSLFQVWNPGSKTDLMSDYKSDMSRMVEYLKGFDVVHTVRKVHAPMGAICK